VSTARELVESRELLRNLTLRELRSKYKRSALGWAWSLLNPLATVGIYGVVFGALLKIDAPTGDPSGIDNFTLYLTCALLPWNFLSTSIASATGSLVANANLLKKVYFPREYLVASTVLAWLISFLIEMAVLCVAFLFFGQLVVQWIPVVIAIALVQTVFVMGYALILSALNVYFRDVQHLIAIFLQVWFYLTPIVYVMDVYIPEERSVLGITVPVRRLYETNPMVHVVTAYRNVLYDGRFPGWQSMSYLALVSAAVLCVGWGVFLRLDRRMVEEL
jgi:ABC-2 type transport system permease protein